MRSSFRLSEMAGQPRGSHSSGATTRAQHIFYIPLPNTSSQRLTQLPYVSVEVITGMTSDLCAQCEKLVLFSQIYGPQSSEEERHR